MRIAMITADYLPNIGGITSHIVEISRAMVKQGQDVRVWFWDSHNREGVSVEGVPTELLEFKPISLGPRGIRYSFKLAKVFQEKIAVFAPEILHVHTLVPLSLCMRWLGGNCAYRRILTNHSSGYLHMFESWSGRQKARFYCSAFDGLLAPSEELIAKSQILNLGEGRYRYIPNGVDAAKFAPGDKHVARRLLNLPDGRIILLATRRFAVKNGLRYLAQSLDVVRREIPDVLCVFCGDTYDYEEWATVKNIVSECDLQEHVRFEGAVSNDRIRHYLNACDVVILPSLIEATSMSGLEAMSAARPIVGTKVGGIPELVVDGVTGILVEPANAGEMARGIIQLVKEQDLEKLGRAARQRVLDCFTWEKIASRTVDFYQTIQEMPPR